MDPAAAKMIFLQAAGLSTGLFLFFRSHERGGWLARHANKFLVGSIAVSLAFFVVFVTGY